MKTNDFAEAIIDLFPPYRWDETTHRAWTNGVARECAGFAPEVRTRAYDELVRKHKGTTPAVARVIEACVEAKRWIDAEKPRTSAGTADADHAAEKRAWNLSEARNKTVAEALQTPLAKQALREGWHLAFRDFVRVHGATPHTPAEIRKCKMEAADFNETIAELRKRIAATRAKEAEEAQHKDPEHDTWIPLGAGLNQALLRLGMSMLAKRDEVARIIEGKK